MENTRDHWDGVYQNKNDQQVSWSEPVPEVSLRLLKAAGMTHESCVCDVGGGISHLVECLVDQGLECLAVLDVAPAAIERARNRLGARASIPTWVVADVTGDWALKPMDIWHDRAVFHFLTDAQSRVQYRRHLAILRRRWPPSLPESSHWWSRSLTSTPRPGDRRNRFNIRGS
jgi:trans-aconitate methyltransferase